MKFRFLTLFVISLLVFGTVSTAFGQQQRQRQQTELSNTQRLDVMTSKLDSMRRSLQSAISATPTEKNSKEKPNADDPAVRLKGLDKEVSSIQSQVADIRAKNDRAEQYDVTKLDQLETSVTEINTRVETVLQATASSRTAPATASSDSSS